MSKNYVYRLDHDTGFAPHIEGDDFCSLSGCKPVIERCAKPGGWVIGIGGKGTCKPNKLIYAMKVKENLLFKDFKKKYPKESTYLDKRQAGLNVLISREFYYFGNNAIDLPPRLKPILWNRHGCKCVSDQDLEELKKFLGEKGFHHGKFGKPNNM